MSVLQTIGPYKGIRTILIIITTLTLALNICSNTFGSFRWYHGLHKNNNNTILTEHVGNSWAIDHCLPFSRYLITFFIKKLIILLKLFMLAEIKPILKRQHSILCTCLKTHTHKKKIYIYIYIHRVKSIIFDDILNHVATLPSMHSISRAHTQQTAECDRKMKTQCYRKYS